MATKKSTLNPLLVSASMLLNERWKHVLGIDLAKVSGTQWNPVIKDLICAGSTYPYVLMGQVLGKATDIKLNALCLQDSSLLQGAWDARTLASKVVVPWNKAAGKPFSGNNDDPYVNNPARYKNFGDEMKSKAGNKEQYANLFSVVEFLENNAEKEALKMLDVVLVEIRRSLEINKRDYLGPARVSHADVMKVLEMFHEERSNGVRLQVSCYAVLKAFAKAFPNFGVVRSYSTNSSDASSKRAGDIERIIGDQIDFAIEVKDRPISLSDLESSIVKARLADIKSLLFVIQTNTLTSSDSEAIKTRAAHEFTRGIDVNITMALPFFSTVLSLLNPEQRANFLEVVHDSLHELGAHYSHVMRWSELVRDM